MSEIESIVQQAESLVAFGSYESARELATMRSTLKRIRELSLLPDRISSRLDIVLAAIPPRFVNLRRRVIKDNPTSN